MIYKIPVVWNMGGIANVEADNLQDAIDKLEFVSLSEMNGDYMDDSFEVQGEELENFNSLSPEDIEGLENGTIVY